MTPSFYEERLGRLIEVETSTGRRKVDIYTEEGFAVLSNLWLRSSWQRKFTYEITWMGVPVIQLPEDLLIMQELINKVRPEVIVEAGVAHGGATVFYASLLELLGRGRVIGVDIEIRRYNRLAIMSHPLSERITLIEGSSIDPAVVQNVEKEIGKAGKTLVVLDSNHTRDHVRRELEHYGRLVTPGSYIVVFDGIIEVLDDAPNGSPEWRTDNPLAAIEDYLRDHPEFEVDAYYNRLGVTHCPRGFLKKKK
jgi:cephalosporin hydroxylase